jgi:hypothetical protein
MRGGRMASEKQRYGVTKVRECGSRGSLDCATRLAYDRFGIPYRTSNVG